MGAIWVMVVLIGLVVLWAIYTYNRLVVLRTRIDNAWSQIDVQMRRRFDLIPNLVETVKGYAGHERETLENVTRARAAMGEAKTVQEQAQAQNMITSALKTLFAVAEQYPNLKANENFMMLQEELAGTENKIAYARQFYNDTVQVYNAMIQMFPQSIIAGMGSFRAREFFEIVEPAARAPVRVTFERKGAPPQPPSDQSTPPGGAQPGA